MGWRVGFTAPGARWSATALLGAGVFHTDPLGGLAATLFAPGRVVSAHALSEGLFGGALTWSGNSLASLR